MKGFSAQQAKQWKTVHTNSTRKCSETKQINVAYINRLALFACVFRSTHSRGIRMAKWLLSQCHRGMQACCGSGFVHPYQRNFCPQHKSNMVMELKSINHQNRTVSSTHSSFSWDYRHFTCSGFFATEQSANTCSRLEWNCHIPCQVCTRNTKFIQKKNLQSPVCSTKPKAFNFPF